MTEQELETIHEYLFDRYDKLVEDRYNLSILKEDREANDKRFDIIKHFKDNDKGYNQHIISAIQLHILCTKYTKNFLFSEPDKLKFHLRNFVPIINITKKEYYDKYIFEDINQIYKKYKIYYNEIIINKRTENRYDTDIYIAFSFIDELLKGIKKDKEEEIIEQQKLDKQKKLEEDKKLEKEKELEKEIKLKELQEQQNIQTQKELQKLKKQNAQTQKELQKLKKQNTQIQDKKQNTQEEKNVKLKQEIQKQTITKSKSDCEAHKKKKKPISATIKRLVWNTNIGEQIGKAKCMCCNVTDITQMSFNCGHIIAESNGGETIVSNLKPICQNCNSSMGTKDMEEFIKTLK